MFLVAIGVCDNAEIIKTDIYRQLDEAKNDGIDIAYDDYYVGGTLFVRCGIRDKLLNILTDRKVYEEFKYILSKALTEVIISHYELKLLRKIAKANFFYLSDRERTSVMENAQKLLKEEKMMQPGGFYKATRRSKIMRSILEYLDIDNEINIEGFINFRLNMYINELNETIERALEIFVAEREYNEFIKLLRYFVEIQECKIDTIHLCQSKDGRYIMYDEKRNRVSSEYFDELRSEILDEKINYDDLLISTLITISPNKITIHDLESFKNKELVQTIMNVFAERITICSKCDLCSSQVESKETNNYSL
ncbi:MAG: putative sporulation protein YtxC [Clostridia bacterium]